MDELGRGLRFVSGGLTGQGRTLALAAAERGFGACVGRLRAAQAGEEAAERAAAAEGRTRPAFQPQLYSFAKGTLSAAAQRSDPARVSERWVQTGTTVRGKRVSVAVAPVPSPLIG